jgi:D-serine deaminase-like pyridoxal phosphate-dependent protein
VCRALHTSVQGPARSDRTPLGADEAHRLQPRPLMIALRGLLLLFLLAGCSHLRAVEPSYYAGLNQELRQKGIGRPVILIDLDRLDHNLEVVKGRLREPLHFRAVEKSLPSADLLNYILDKTGSHRVMVFHHPFLKTLLTTLPADTDFLFGKTIPVNGVAEVFAQLDDAQQAEVTQRVQWLIDSPQTLEAYLAYFRRTGRTFCANLEIDVGLHRGGAGDVAELDAMLKILRANRQTVTLTGLMGYDGHAFHLPVPDFMKLWATGVTLRGIEATYQQLWDHVRDVYPDLAATVRTLNGGGSSSYALYKPGTVITDISLGSALLKPWTYDILTLQEHVPAVFIATPLLKKLHPAMIPFVGRISLSADVDGYYIYGGAWAVEPQYPEGLQMHSLMSSPPNQTLVSNQAFLYGAAEPKVEPGDFVFFRPGESDNIFLFDEIHLVRAGKLVGTFKPFTERY